MDAWLLLDSGPGDPAWNMALDEALLEFAPQTATPVLRFYGWTQAAATFGYFQRSDEIERATPLRPAIRRPTAGGLVPHERDWTYSVAIPNSHAWYGSRAAESYARMHRWIQTAFSMLGLATALASSSRREIPGQCFAGYEQSDLLWCERKIAGAAQRRTTSGLLIQGSVQPPPPGITRAAWQDAMRNVSLQRGPARWTEWEVPEALRARAELLRTEKYSRDEYNRKR